MVVTLVDGGDGTDIVVVRSVVVVCIGGSDAQAASIAVPPSSDAVNNRRMQGFVSVITDLLGQGRVGCNAHRSGGAATG